MKKHATLLVLSVLLATSFSEATTRKDGQEAHGTVGNKFCEELAKVIDIRYSPFAEECRDYIPKDKDRNRLAPKQEK